MPKEFTYADAGVDRKLRAESKKGLKVFEETYEFLPYGNPTVLPYNKIFPIGDNGMYLDHVHEGIGTKVLLAQLADKYDTIGQDGVAMVVNDVVRSGANPFSFTENIDIQQSDPHLLNELNKGLLSGLREAKVAKVGGETADVPSLIKNVTGKEGRGFHIDCSCFGYLFEEDIIWGGDLHPGDAVIGLRSSGLHSNGISMVREVLFKAWGGKYNPFVRLDGFDRELVYEALKPTRIYVKPILRVAHEGWLKAAVHITGDAYLKFEKLIPFNKGIGFEFYNFKPQPIFQLIQDTAQEVKGEVSNEEMLKTFNMGWGFAGIVKEDIKDNVIDILEKEGEEADQIGRVTDTENIIVVYKKKKILLK